MPPKKSSAAANKKGISEKGKIKESIGQPTAKVEKIAFSFSATANLNDGGETAGNVPYLWASKNSMIRCALTYGDTVIVQTIKDDKRFLASKSFFQHHYAAASVQLMKGLKETEVLCSESLFRCLSPSMDIIPVTVYRLAPNSIVSDADHLSISLFYSRNQLDRFNKDKTTTNSNQDFIHTVLMTMIGTKVLKGQSVLFSYMGVTIRGVITDLSIQLPPEMDTKESVLIGHVNHNTQIQFFFQDDSIITSPEQPLSTSSSINQLVGGLEGPKQQLQEVLNSALFLSSRYKELHIPVPKGVLLYGPPGSGKTLLVRSLVTCFQTSFFTVSISALLSQYLGESENRLTELFNQARLSAPSIVFLDEIDALCPPRDRANAAASRLCSLLLALFDEISEQVVVIGATNRPNALDSALRRPGRFDREIEIGVPTIEEKRSIIQVLLQSIQHQLTDTDMDWLAEHTNGFTGADLRLLFTDACLLAMDEKALMGCRTDLSLSLEDVKRSLPHVRPSALREITVVNPNIHWSDIGGLENVKRRMRELIEWPMMYSTQLARFHITPPKGVLLYGPPGCSKTLLAKAVATEANMNFISVKGPELYSKYVGESEQALAAVFRRARMSAPCVIFFDEIDAFASARSSTSGVTERVVSQFLTELDGIHMLKRVLVIAATNRPDLLDVALLRPGRLDTHIFLGLPDLDAREKILNVHLKGVPLADDVVVRDIAEKTEGYSGAELAAVCTEASMEALNENINAEAIHQAHLLHSLTVVRPRTSPDLLQLYLRFNDKKCLVY